MATYYKRPYATDVNLPHGIELNTVRPFDENNPNGDMYRVTVEGYTGLARDGAYVLFADEIVGL